MCLERLLERDFVHRRPRAVAFSRRSVRRCPIVVIRRKCGAIPRPLTQHLGDLRVGHFQTVLDGIASAIQGPLQTDSVVGMAGNFLLPSMGFVHDGFQLFHGQRRLRNKVALLVDPRAVRHVHL